MSRPDLVPHSISSLRPTGAVFPCIVLALAVLTGGGLTPMEPGSARAQTLGTRHAAPQQAAPQSSGSQRRVPAAMELPAAARPARPSSQFGAPQSGSIGRSAPTGAGGRAARTQGTPGTPTDPTVPIGGIEYLAAAGAAYALHRLRRRGGEGEDETDDDPA